MARSGKTIDAIKVGLGIDASGLNDSIRAGLGSVSVETQLSVPAPTMLRKWVKDIGEAAEKAKLGVKLGVAFDDKVAGQQLQTLVDSLSGKYSVKVPIEFIYPEGGAQPGGGGAGPATGGGRRGPAPGGAGAPSAPAATGPATSVAAAAVAGAAAGRAGRGKTTPAAPAAPVAAAAVTGAAVGAAAAPPAAPAAPVAATAGVAAVQGAKARRGRAAAAPAVSPLQAVAAKGVQDTLAAQGIAISPQQAAQLTQLVASGLEASTRQATQPPAAAEAAPLAAGVQHRRQSPFQQIFAPRDDQLPNRMRGVARQVRRMVREGGYSTTDLQITARLAMQGQELPPALRHMQPFWEMARYQSLRGSEMRATNAAARRAGPIAAARAAPAIAFNTAMEAGDFAAVDAMYPGVGTLFSQGKNQEAVAAYFAGAYKETDKSTAERARVLEEKGIDIGPRGQQVLGQRRGMMRKRWDVLAERYPLDFAMFAWAGSGAQWVPGAEGQAGGWHQPFLHKKKGGPAAISGGTVASSPPVSRSRQFELMASDPAALHVELNTLKELEKAGPLSEDDATYKTKLEKAIGSFKTKKGRLAASPNETPFPVSDDPRVGPVLAYLHQLATNETPMGSPEAKLEREVQQATSVRLRDWLEQTNKGLFGQFMSAAASPGQHARAQSLAKRLASLPEGKELPADSPLNRTIGDVAGRGRRRPLNIIDSSGPSSSVPGHLADQRIHDMFGLQGGGYKPGERWYRGGSSAQDLWIPGRMKGESGEDSDPFSTLGAGLYMTDEASAHRYAQIRARSHGASPVVDSRIVDIPENKIWRPEKGVYFEEGPLLDEWQGFLADRERSLKKADAPWFQTAALHNTNDYINHARWYRDSAMRGPQKGKPPTLHQSIGSPNQDVFAEFMQGKGYEGLLGEEGGEAGGFTHPSLVVFDPKNKALHMAMGGLRDRLMQARIQSLMDEGRVEESQALQRELEQSRGGWGISIPPGTLDAIKQRRAERIQSRLAQGLSAEEEPRAPVDYGPEATRFDPLPMSPFAQALREKRLPPKDMTGMDSGGRKGRPSSLSDLPGVAENMVGITEVGEQGREWIVRQRDGSEFVVPHHQLPQFRGMVGMADGGPRLGASARNRAYLASNDPEALLWGPDFDARNEIWREGAKQGLFRRRRVHGAFAPGYEPAIQPIQYLPPDLQNRGAGPAGLFVDAPGRTFATRRGVADVRALAEGRASTLGTLSANIQRVHVVNWPAGLGGPAGAAAPTRLGRPSAEAEATPLAARGGGGGGGGTMPPGAAVTPEEIAGAATKTPAAKPTPIMRAEAKMSGAEAVDKLRDRLDKVGIDISEALQKSPVRALSVAMGQIAQTMIGGRAGILERAGIARAQRRTAEGLTGQLEAASSARDLATREVEFLAEKYGVTFGKNEQGLSVLDEAGMSALSATKPEQVAELQQRQAEEQEQEERRAFYKPRAEAATTEAERAAKGILSPGQQFKAQLVGLGGIVGGTMLFTAAMQASQMALAALSDVTNKTVDSLSNWQLTLNAVTGDLAKSIVQASGDIGAATGSLVGEAGLPAGTDVRALIARSARYAGAEQFQRGTDILRGEASARTGLGNRTEGLGTGFNNGPLAGWPIAGLFGWVGQQQGMAELTAGRLATAQLPQITTAAQTFPQAPVTIPRSSGDIAGDFFGATGELYGQTQDNTMLGAGAEAEVAGIVGAARVGAQTQAIAEARRKTDIATAEFSAQVDELVGGLNKSLEKVDVPDMFVHIDPDAPENKARVEAFKRAMKEIGAESYTQPYLERGVIATTAGGEGINAERLNRLFQGLSDSALQPTLEELLKTNQRAYQAQIAGIQRNAQLTREVEIPTDFFMQYIAKPLAGALRGIPWSAGITAPGSRGAEGAIGARYGGMVQSTYQQMQPYIAQGRQQLLGMATSPEERQNIEDEIASVERLGASIVRLQTRASNLQLSVEQAQYNEQLYQTRRSLSDVLGILGKTGAQTSELGRLTRAQIMDQRELARIQLARNQREINFQLALSRLQAPGETPEERAVRRREAEMLAREAQREQDINRRSTTRGFRIEDIGYQRQARDLAKQIELIQQARRVSIEVRGIQQVIEAKQQLMGVKQQMLGVSRSVGLEIRRAGNAIIANLESRLGLFTNAQVEQVNDWATRIVRTVNRAFKMGTTGDPQPTMPGTGGGTRHGARQARAAGYLGVTSGPTAFIAGEAGTEHVVVLRNPRMGMTAQSTGMPGGHAGNTYINLQLNATVKDEADEDRLARKVARLLHQQTALAMGG